MLEKALSALRAAAAVGLAVAATYSACMARDSARTAQSTVELARQSAEAAKGSAEAATKSAAVAREWMESSERALIAPTEWNLVRDPSGTILVEAQLRDIGDVPTALRRVCVWQGSQLPAADALRNYRDASIPAGTLIYRQVFHRVRYPIVRVPMQAGRGTTFLSTLYTFSREGTPESETWKVEARANFTLSEERPLGSEERQLGLSVVIEDIRQVEEQRC